MGTQYRSAIFYHTPEQQDTAEAVMAELTQAGLWPQPIVTTLEPLDEFFPAEAYHQDYYRRNPAQPYCQAMIEPKLAKARKQFLDKLKRSGGA